MYSIIHKVTNVPEISNALGDTPLPVGGRRIMNKYQDPVLNLIHERNLSSGFVSEFRVQGDYVKKSDTQIEFCQVSWTDLDAAKEWAELIFNSMTSSESIEVIDESGNILFSLSK